jgi:hypothetical protein
VNRRFYKTFRQPETRDEQAPGHEDSQFAKVAEVAPPGLPSDPPSRPDLRHQQDQPPLQGAPGLIERTPPVGGVMTADGATVVSVRAVVFDVGK